MTTKFSLKKQQNGLYTVTMVDTTVHTIVETDVRLEEVPEPAPLYLFHDDFASMNLKKSENGIYWSSSNAGSGDKLPMVTKDMLFNGKPTLKFTFGGGVPEDDAWCEQRFKIDSKLSDVWIHYYRYYPSGTEAVNVGPKWVHRNAPGSDNNKILHLWGGSYEGYSIMVGIAAWESGGKDVLYAGFGSNQIKPFGQRGLPSAPAQDDSTLGRWVKVKAHFKAATAANNDGVIQFWEDAASKLDFRNVPLYPKEGLNNWFTEGYLMGWANTGFEKTTHCYIADFKLNDKPF